VPLAAEGRVRLYSPNWDFWAKPRIRRLFSWQ